jgi:hypothetical protein
MTERRRARRASGQANEKREIRTCHRKTRVLDFVGYLTERQERERERDLLGAQESALKTVWDNLESQAWDRV